MVQPPPAPSDNSPPPVGFRVKDIPSNWTVSNRRFYDEVSGGIVDLFTLNDAQGQWRGETSVTQLTDGTREAARTTRDGRGAQVDEHRLFDADGALRLVVNTRTEPDGASVREFFDAQGELVRRIDINAHGDVTDTPIDKPPAAPVDYQDDDPILVAGPPSSLPAMPQRIDGGAFESRLDNVESSGAPKIRQDRIEGLPEYSARRQEFERYNKFLSDTNDLRTLAANRERAEQSGLWTKDQLDRLPAQIDARDRLSYELQRALLANQRIDSIFRPTAPEYALAPNGSKGLSGSPVIETLFGLLQPYRVPVGAVLVNSVLNERLALVNTMHSIGAINDAQRDALGEGIRAAQNGNAFGALLGMSRSFLGVLGLGGAAWAGDADAMRGTLTLAQRAAMTQVVQDFQSGVTNGAALAQIAADARGVAIGASREGIQFSGSIGEVLTTYWATKVAGYEFLAIPRNAVNGLDGLLFKVGPDGRVIEIVLYDAKHTAGTVSGVTSMGSNNAATWDANVRAAIRNVETSLTLDPSIKLQLGNELKQLLQDQPNNIQLWIITSTNAQVSSMILQRIQNATGITPMVQRVL